MDSADEWWKVEISDDVKHRSEEKIISGSSESLQKNNDSETNNGTRKQVILFTSLTFLIGLLFNWTHWADISGFDYIFDFDYNLSWFLEYNYDPPDWLSDQSYYQYSLLEQFDWLLFISSPLLLSINVLIMMYYYLIKNHDIGRITSYIHFSLFFTIFTVSYINFDYVPFFDYGLGFNIIALTGLGLNPYTSRIIFQYIHERYYSNQYLEKYY
tara:strand:+ start:11596 stop:12234 length:639 start_codon:yes stop_codon:yes gene_type:complete